MTMHSGVASLLSRNPGPERLEGCSSHKDEIKGCQGPVDLCCAFDHPDAPKPMATSTPGLSGAEEDGNGWFS